MLNTMVMKLKAVVFLETTYASRDRDFCDVVEFLVDRLNCSIHVISSSTAEASRIDGMLWTFRKESFIPHTILGAGDTVGDRLEKVFITIGSAVLKGCDVIISMDADYDLDIFKNYNLCIIFVLSDDETYKNKARSLWRELGKRSILKKHAELKDKNAWMSLLCEISKDCGLIL